MEEKNIFKSAARESKKITWPGKKEAFKQGFAIIVATIIIAAIISVYDFAVQHGVDFLSEKLSIGSGGIVKAIVYVLFLVFSSAVIFLVLRQKDKSDGSGVLFGNHINEGSFVKKHYADSFEGKIARITAVSSAAILVLAFIYLL